MLGIIKKFLKLLADDPLFFCHPGVYGVGIIGNYHASDILDKKMNVCCWIAPNHAGDFYADPFITDYFGKPIVFFEYFYDKENRGNISYAYLNDILMCPSNINNPMVYPALNLSTHLSYPYLFEYNNELYMIPENNQSNTISLYKSLGAPDKWSKVSTLIDNFAGIDSVVFEFNGYWWLFSTPNIPGTTASNTDLYIWYSETPLGRWKPHKKNPIQSSTPISRGAGKPFIKDGVLYRPTQDCTRTYGGELLIKEIVILTPNEFEEKIVRKFSGHEPFSYTYHTYNSSSSGYSVIDGKRKKYSLLHMYYFIKNIIMGRVKIIS